MSLSRDIFDSWVTTLSDQGRRINLPLGIAQSAVCQRLSAAGDYSAIAHLREAGGLFSLTLMQVRPDLDLNGFLSVATRMIEAAHWFKKGADAVRAEHVGRRAFHEFGAQWYVLEMKGDAAATFDVATAATCYRRALVGFETMERVDQLGEGAEIFPGDYLIEMTDHFLPRPPFTPQEWAKERIPYKMHHWLRLRGEEACPPTLREVPTRRAYLLVGTASTPSSEDHLEKHRAILDCWRSALAGVDPIATTGLQRDPTPLYHRFLLSGELALVAALLEAWGAFVLCLSYAASDRNLLPAAGAALIKSGHWYRKAGDGARAELVGRRAYAELDEWTIRTKLADHGRHEPYVLELMGDAAALFDAGKAADRFRRALAGYEAAGQEPDTFLGAHLTYTAQRFLPMPVAGYAVQDRVRAKMHHWLGDP